MKSEAAMHHQRANHPPVVSPRLMPLATIVVLAAAMAGCDTLHCFLTSPAGTQAAKTR